jgi:hypothetical protein
VHDWRFLAESGKIAQLEFPIFKVRFWGSSKIQTLRDESSSSDSDAPISRAAIRQAKEAAAEAAKLTASDWRPRLVEQAAAKRVVGATAASKALSKKQKAATAQSDCTGSPKYDALCVCDFCMMN